MSLSVKDGSGASRLLKTSTDGSDLVPHHNVDTIANPVPCAQSGAWSVSITSTLPAWTGAGNIGKAEDSSHTSGDVGVAVLTVRSNSPTAKTDADGDYANLLSDSTGRLHATSIRNADGIGIGSAVVVQKRAVVAAGVGTDVAFVSSVASKKLRVLAVLATSAGTATLVFNSKPAGAGTAVSSTINLVAGVPLVLPHEVCGWFETNSGEGLTVTVGTSTVNLSILYAEV